ncbi:MAG: transposase-like protein [Maribacter sp.]|jgi:transposase-like protein
MSRRRKQYSKEEKLEVVKLSLEDKESIKELAVRFEVSENTIYNWRSKYLKDGDSP